ncbi:MAG TPA: hypothetical protein VED87_09415, partial [Methylocystis sp.]|nr:hypothetical protein [Methylocystis sp.]
ARKTVCLFVKTRYKPPALSLEGFFRYFSENENHTWRARPFRRRETAPHHDLQPMAVAAL